MGDSDIRALILYNPNSGRGRGQRVAESVRAMLLGGGAEAELFATAQEEPGVFPSSGRAGAGCQGHQKALPGVLARFPCLQGSQSNPLPLGGKGLPLEGKPSGIP